MSKINAAWREVRLADILTYLAPPTELNDLNEYITITVKRRHGGLEERERLFGHQIKTKKQFRLLPGAFIISRIQCWHQAYAIVPDNVPPNMIASTNYDQFAVSPEVDFRFFWWLSHSPQFTETVRGSAVGVVIEKMVFDREAWLQKTIPLPSLDEQRRIVARIEELAAKIEEARSLKVEALAETESFIGATARRILNEVGPPVIRLESCTDKNFEAIQTGPFGAQLGSGDFVEAGTPVLTIGNVQYGGLRLTDLKHVSDEKAKQLARYTVMEGDILFARMGTVGRCCVVPSQAEGWLTNYHIIRVRLDKSQVEPRYAHWSIQAAPEVEEYLEEKTRGATRKGVNSSIVAKIPFRLPPLPEQRRIVAYLDNLQAKVDALKRLQTETAAELDALLPSILDKAFKGEL